MCIVGSFYVMMTPQEVLQATTTNQRTLFPRTGIVKVEPGTRVTRDDRRRATHNEGENVETCDSRISSSDLHLDLSLNCHMGIFTCHFAYNTRNTPGTNRANCLQKSMHSLSLPCVVDFAPALCVTTKLLE